MTGSPWFAPTYHRICHPCWMSSPHEWTWQCQNVGLCASHSYKRIVPRCSFQNLSCHIYQSQNKVYWCWSLLHRYLVPHEASYLYAHGPLLGRTLSVQCCCTSRQFLSACSCFPWHCSWWCSCCFPCQHRWRCCCCCYSDWRSLISLRKWEYLLCPLIVSSVGFFQ